MRWQVRYLSDWSGREEWLVAGSDWGRRSAGASLRLSGLGEVVRGVPCGGHQICLESADQPGNYLVAWQEGRMVWQRQPATSECGHVSQIYITPNTPLSLLSSPPAKDDYAVAGGMFRTAVTPSI